MKEPLLAPEHAQRPEFAETPPEAQRRTAQLRFPHGLALVAVSQPARGHTQILAALSCFGVGMEEEIGSPYIAQAGLKLLAIHLPRYPKCLLSLYASNAIYNVRLRVKSYS